jgi:hypothetical protein
VARQEQGQVAQQEQQVAPQEQGLAKKRHEQPPPPRHCLQALHPPQTMTIVLPGFVAQDHHHLQLALHPRGWARQVAHYHLHPRWPHRPRSPLRSRCCPQTHPPRLPGCHPRSQCHRASWVTGQGTCWVRTETRTAPLRHGSLDSARCPRQQEGQHTLGRPPSGRASAPLPPLAWRAAYKATLCHTHTGEQARGMTD